MGRKLSNMGAAAFIAASSIIGGPVTLKHEGMRLAPYYDSAGVKTWCAGETEIGYQEKFTPAECGTLYQIRYGFYSYRTMMMYSEKGKETVTPEMHAAFTDMAYNVGISAVENSTMIHEVNAGHAAPACMAILLYKKSGGKDCSLPENKHICGGIWDRRKEMNSLCMSGVQ